MRPLACLMVLFPASAFAQGTRADYDRAAILPGQIREAFGNPRVEPNWDVAGDSFTYKREVPGAPPKFVRVEAATGKRTEIVALPESNAPARRSRPAAGRQVARRQI